MAELQATLPTEVGGDRLDFVLLVDDRFLSGHPIDDVLQQLGKARADASVVFLESSEGLGSVGAASVDGVDGNGLLSAVLETWYVHSVVVKTQQTVQGRPAWLLVENSGQQTYAHADGQVVYFASSSDADRARALAEALP